MVDDLRGPFRSELAIRSAAVAPAEWNFSSSASVDECLLAPTTNALASIERFCFEVPVAAPVAHLCAVCSSTTTVRLVRQRWRASATLPGLSSLLEIELSLCQVSK